MVECKPLLRGPGRGGVRAPERDSGVELGRRRGQGPAARGGRRRGHGRAVQVDSIKPRVDSAYRFSA